MRTALQENTGFNDLADFFTLVGFCLCNRHIQGNGLPHGGPGADSLHPSGETDHSFQEPPAAVD